VPQAADRAALVALLRRSRRPLAEELERLEQLGSPRAVLDRELTETDEQLTFAPVDPEPLIARASAAIAGWEAEGLRLITILDPDYPANLRLVHDRPPLLFTRGRLRGADTRSVAIIGSRHPSEHGLAVAWSMSAQLAEAGFTIVSGLAEGIDTAAHEAALAGGGRTIAVVGTGLRHSYPAQNAALQKRIGDLGVLISPFWPETEPHPETFRRRNAVMSGLGCGTVIIEATHRSGARLQARLALSHARPVFVWHELLAQPWARDLASRPGVHVVDGPAQVEAILNRLGDLGDLVE
jgi:DNA processing protein